MFDAPEVAHLDAARERDKDKQAFIDAIRKVGSSRRLHVYDTQNRYAVTNIESRARLLAMAPAGLSLILSTSIGSFWSRTILR